MIEPLMISDDVWEKLPGLIVITGTFHVGEPRVPEIADYLSQGWNALTREVEMHGYKTHPLIAQWREALRFAGVPLKKCPPSIEAIAKRTRKGGEPFSINPVVDTYNAISMNLTLPFGAYDIPQLDGRFRLRLSERPEPFTALGSDKSEETVEGEIVYSDDRDILTRHFLWRQSEKCKVTPESRHCVFVCELLETMGEELLSRAKELIEKQIVDLLDATLSEVTVLRQ